MIQTPRVFITEIDEGVGKRQIVLSLEVKRVPVDRLQLSRDL
jgi:hypothetical protein